METMENIQLKVNTNYTFEKAFISVFNSQAVEIVKDFFTNESSNLLIVSSEIGLGKSYLLHAACNHYRQVYPTKRAYFNSMDELQQNFVNAIVNNSRSSFVQSFEEYDSLFIDDMDLLVNKEKTQAFFVRILDAYLQANKKVIITCLPVDFQKLLESKKLASLLSEGVVCNINCLEAVDQINYMNYRLNDFKSLEERNLRSVKGFVDSFITYDNIGNETKELAKQLNDDALQDVKFSKVKSGKNSLKVKLKAWHINVKGKAELKNTSWLSVGDNLEEITFNASYQNLNIIGINKSLTTEKWTVIFGNGMKLFLKDKTRSL